MYVYICTVSGSIVNFRDILYQSNNIEISSSKNLDRFNNRTLIFYHLNTINLRFSDTEISSFQNSFRLIYFVERRFTLLFLVTR